MESAPPSYEKATVIDVWEIVAPYLPKDSLCSAALVSSRWHRLYTPHIWGNPAAHFGLENDEIYAALTKFRRTLHIARLHVRALTHTLHLPPADPELYEDPRTEWLRDILKWLPNLQSLIVRGLPFFDHGALQALAQARKPTQTTSQPVNTVVSHPGPLNFPRPVISASSYGLRLLDASRCPNITPASLSTALNRFEALLSLNLSFTLPARDPTVWSSLHSLQGLQLLKLRGIGIRDSDVDIISKSIGLRVRSLDLRDNYVTDRGVELLLDRCFKTPSPPDFVERGYTTTTNPSSVSHYLSTQVLDIYRGPDFEEYLEKAFTSRFVSRLAFEDMPPEGITHLYIANNKLTVRGVCNLLRPQCLYVCDFGSHFRPSIRELRELPDARADGETSDVETLSTTLNHNCGHWLTFLRITHNLVTQGRSEAGKTTARPEGTELDDTTGGGSNHPAEALTAMQPPNVSSLTTDRTARLDAHRKQFDTLHPAMLPHLKTLILTDVPRLSPDPSITGNLIRFISDCAREAHLAQQYARLDYSLPPGRAGHAATLRRSADRFFALQRLVLELASDPVSLRRNHGPDAPRRRDTRSVTEDHDSEALWEAAEADFSFFNDEECDSPEQEPARPMTQSGRRTGGVTGQTQGPGKQDRVQMTTTDNMIDTVAVLSRFRNERRQAHQHRVSSGDLEVQTEGYWEGVVQVVHPGKAGADEDNDHYYRSARWGHG